MQTMKSALYLDLHLEMYGQGKLITKLYNKHDDFSFCIVDFPFVCDNIPSAPAFVFSYHITTYMFCQSLL